MSNTATVIFTTDSASGNLNDVFINSNPNLALTYMQNYLSGIVSGNAAASLNVKINDGNSVAASGDVTVTAPISGDKLLINGVAFTAGSSFAIGGSDTITATNLSDAINASANALISGIVSAESSSNVVTITAVSPGTTGNLVTLEGQGTGAIDPDGSGVSASGTLTIASVSSGDTASVNGTSVTAVDKREKTQVTCIADLGVVAYGVINVPATAAAAQGDYFVLTNPAGATAALWLDIDAAGVAPSGAAYVAANSKITVSISTGNTAAQNAVILAAAAATILNWSAVDNLDGTVTYTQSKTGVSNINRHNENDSGSGSFSIASGVMGTASNLLNKYFTFKNAADAINYYMWYNVNSEGVDPAVAASTGIEVAVAAGAVANTVASASRAKFALSPLSTHFTESGATDKIIFQNKLVGTTTNTADGVAATGFAFSTTNAGGSVGATEFQIDASNTTSATNLKTTLNAQAALSDLIVATSALGVVTVMAREEGIEGNNITLSATGNITANAARLAGGTDSALVRLAGGTNDSGSTTYNFGRV